MADLSDLERFFASCEIIENGDLSDLNLFRELVDAIPTIGDEDDRSDLRERLVRQLISSQRANDAHAVASLIEAPMERSLAYHALYNFHSDAERNPDAETCLAEAKAAALIVPEPWQKGERLGRVAQSYFERGLSAEAVDLWKIAAAAAEGGQDRGMQDELDCGGVLGEISELLANAGYSDQAMEVAHSIKNSSRRARTLTRLADR